MAQISWKPLKKELYNQVYNLLLKILTDSYSKPKAKLLLDDLFSPTEQVVLAKRLAIALLLAKGYKYEEIVKILNVSMPTIAAVNLNLKFKGEGYRHFVNRVMTEQKVKKYWEQIQDMVLDVGSFGGKGSKGWRYLRQEVGKKRFKKSTPISD
jgi:uncharacterized protein YerC